MSTPVRSLIGILDSFIDMVEPWVARLVRTRRWIVVERADADFDFYLAQGGRTELIGVGSVLGHRDRRLISLSKNDEVELRLAAVSVVASTFKLPGVGTDHVDQIIAHRIDRLTPWRPEKLLYGFAVAAKPGADGQVDVNFAATSIEIADHGVARLQAFGMTPSRLGSAAEPIEARLRMDLFRGREDRMRSRRRTRIGIFAVALLALSVAAFAITTYLTFEAENRIVELDQRLASARSELVGGAGNSTGRQKALALIDSKTQLNARFLLIDTLARIIPDNTVLDELEIEDTTIRLAGTSIEAAALIEILEAEPEFSDAAFAAPVTRQPDQRDRFTVTVVRRRAGPDANP